MRIDSLTVTSHMHHYDTTISITNKKVLVGSNNEGFAEGFNNGMYVWTFTDLQIPSFLVKKYNNKTALIPSIILLMTIIHSLLLLLLATSILSLKSILL